MQNTETNTEWVLATQLIEFDSSMIRLEAEGAYLEDNPPPAEDDVEGWLDWVPFTGSPEYLEAFNIWRGRC